jgi:N-acetylglucosamine transport system substrate-binding protein
MSDARAKHLATAAATGQCSRRELLRRAVTIGLVSSTFSGILAACGGGAPTPAAGPAATPAPTGGAAASEPKATLPTGEARNPLKVSEDQPLDSVIFKGGYSDEYAINAEWIYQQAFPKAKVSHQGIQRLQEQLQPRFVGGTPPDVIDNSGAGNLDTAALVAEGQLADLADLMEAPAFDSSGKKFKDTLLPGSQDNAVYDGKQFALLYAYTVSGVWHSSKLLKEKGWEYPKTWDGMLKLCEEIKKGGIAPWTYTGKFPQYLYMVLMPMIYKAGGIEAIKRLDNLEPSAWLQPEVKAAAEALYQLAERGYIMPGSEGLSHTESQAEWLQGKAVFIPVGSWLENEMKDQIPDGFNMVVKPVPSLSANDKVPFEGIQASAGETFIVPSKAKNVQGGKELLRILFSTQGARFFSQNTRALTVVQGSAEGLDLGSAFASVQAAADAAGPNRFTYLFGTWYAQMRDNIKDQLGAMMTKKITPAEFVSKAQEFADATANDGSIKKYKRA